MGLIAKYTRLNPHLRLALVIAPLLAVGGYILAGFFSPGSEPGAPSGPRPLEIDDRCQLLDGVCRLLHREIALNIGAALVSDGTEIFLASSVPLKGAVVGLEGRSPVTLSQRDGPKKWQAHLPYALPAGDTLHLVVATAEHRYFADVPTGVAHGN